MLYVYVMGRLRSLWDAVCVCNGEAKKSMGCCMCIIVTGRLRSLRDAVCVCNGEVRRNEGKLRLTRTAIQQKPTQHC